jgi:hypothetical protein
MIPDNPTISILHRRQDRLTCVLYGLALLLELPLPSQEVRVIVQRLPRRWPGSTGSQATGEKTRLTEQFSML